MLLINYDFYDLHALIIFFRSDPGNTQYLPAIAQIIQYIEADPTDVIDANVIRKILKPYVDPQNELLSWVFTENVYSSGVFPVKNGAYYKIATALLRELVSCSGEDRDRVYALCDAAENILLSLITKKHPKKAIASMIRNYQKQYRPKFLSEELKQL